MLVPVKEGQLSEHFRETERFHDERFTRNKMIVEKEGEGEGGGGVGWRRGRGA